MLAPMFEKVLIARRGEAAARVAVTCRHLGISAIAVYSDKGADGVHVEACDEAHMLEPGSDGLLDPAEIVALAKDKAVDAVYPGYGSHHSHDALARGLAEVGIPCVGVELDALVNTRMRPALRKAAEAAEVTMPPGSGPLEDVGDAEGQAYGLGYPLVVRAIEAGHGIGVHPASDGDELREAWAKASARAEGKGVALCVERCVPRARHIEVLVLCDSRGGVEALCDRERSLCMGGQRLIEECPSPELVFRSDGESLRLSLFDAATRISAQLGCIGLLTIGFLVDADGRFVVTGARIGLPKLHAITEMTTGLDLVALQLQIASGEAIPDQAKAPQPSGHAVGVWLLAAAADELDAPVEEYFTPPYPTRRVRIEPSIIVGAPVAVDDRPLLAKMTVSAPIRHQAVLTLDRVLAATRVSPSRTNVTVLRQVLNHASFHAGQYDVTFLDRLTHQMGD